MDQLINSLRYKSEGTDIDFKSAQYRFIGGTEDEKGALLKDVLAMANAWRDGTGYILLGFKERRPLPAEVVGIQSSIDDAQLQQFISSKVKPKLSFRYEERLYEDKTIGIIAIPKQKRPFYLANAYGKLKSNLVYVRRGSSTDEAEPPEIVVMSQEDHGRGTVRAELLMLTADNQPMPDTISRSFAVYDKRFPDYKADRSALGRSEMLFQSALVHDNSRFWRQYANYLRLRDAAILTRFVLNNRSGIQLTNAKIEAKVSALDGQSVGIICGGDLPDEPVRHWSSMIHSQSVSIPAMRDRQMVVEGEGLGQICHVRIGSLLPGESGGLKDTLAIVPGGPGRFRVELRVLAAELPEPLVSERSIEAAGAVLPLDFEGFKALVSERQRQSRPAPKPKSGVTLRLTSDGSVQKPEGSGS